MDPTLEQLYTQNTDIETKVSKIKNYYILNKIRRPNYFADKSPKSLWHCAVWYGDIAAIKLLIKLNDKTVNVADEFGKTPLHCCLSLEDKEMVTMLLDYQYTSVEAATNEGKTALHLALFNDFDRFTVEKILDKSVNAANLIVAKDNRGYTVLHQEMSSIKSPLDIFELLIDGNKDVVFVQSNLEGLTFMHFAIRLNKERVIKFMLNKCPNIGAIVDGKGRTLLHHTVKYNYEIGSIELLARTNSQILYKIDNKDRTALDYAAIRYRRKKYQYPPDYLSNQSNQMILSMYLYNLHFVWAIYGLGYGIYDLPQPDKEKVIEVRYKIYFGESLVAKLLRNIEK
jgi:ankyrin repeat protein